MHFRSLIALVVLGGLLAPAEAQTRLAWKLKPGDRFYVQVTNKANQTISLMGNDLKEATEQTLVARMTIKSHSETGTEIEQTIESIEVSGEGNAVNLLGTVYDKLKGTSCLVRLDGKMQVQSLEGTDEVVKKVHDAFPLMGEQVARSLVMAQLRLPSDLAFNFALPKEPVQPGSTWSRKSTVPIGPLGTADLDSTFTYQGRSGGYDKIAVTSKMTHKPPKKGESPIAFSKVDFKPVESKATILFDSGRGRFVSQEASLRFKINAAISAMGQEIPVEITSDMQYEAKYLDKLPNLK